MSCNHTHHLPASSSAKQHRAFAVGVVLNASFVVLEIFYGLTANSLALLADALHNLGDVLSLLLAWLAYWWAFRKPKGLYTYGLGRLSIYATFFNGASLIITSAWIIYEALLRLNDPIMPNSLIVALVASVGIAINGITAWFLMQGQKDINVRGAMLHMVADAAVSAGVVLTSFLLVATGWLWLDPVVSIIIAAIITLTAVPLLREGTRLAMDAVPQQIDRDAIKNFIHTHEAVEAVFDLHIWALSTVKTALTAHITIKDAYDHEDVLHDLHAKLKQNFNITHVTIQVERDHDTCVDEHELLD